MIGRRQFGMGRGAAAFAAPAIALAQKYPSGRVTMVVPFPAGGTSDVLARLVGQKMAENWGQAVVVENRPGSNGNLGADAVAKATPDGYTLVLMDVGNLVISPALYKLPFTIEKDFAPAPRSLGGKPEPRRRPQQSAQAPISARKVGRPPGSRRRSRSMSMRAGCCPRARSQGSPSTARC